VDENGEIIDAAPRVVQTQPAPDPVVAAAAQQGGVVRQAQPQTTRDEAIADYQTIARNAKALGLTTVIDANKARSTDDAQEILRKAGAIQQAIDDYRAFEQATTPAAGEQAELIPASPLDAMPA
jgi:hypothetical protein